MNTDTERQAAKIKSLLAEGEHNDMAVARLISDTTRTIPERDDCYRWMYDQLGLDDKAIERIFDKYMGEGIGRVL